MERRARRVAGLLTRLLLAFASSASFLSSASAATASENGVPASVQPMTIPFFIDRKLPRQMKPSLDEALRRISDSRCQEVLTDFTDPQGRRLDLNLAKTGQGFPAYLGWVIFYDGRATPPCEDSRVLAWTNPGSRAVLVCWDQFALQQRTNFGYTANTIIHETLHTLGLGETPPDPRAITAQVAQRCGN